MKTKKAKNQNLSGVEMARAAGKVVKSKPAKGQVLFAMYPDHTWPKRALAINDILMHIIDTLEMAKPLMKEVVAIRELSKAVHFFTCEAAALLNLKDQKALMEVIKKNKSGKLFKNFLKAA